MEAVQKADSGHPGLADGLPSLAPISTGYLLSIILKILTNGSIATGLCYLRAMDRCSSILAYILQAFSLSMDEIKRFSQDPF